MQSGHWARLGIAAAMVAAFAAPAAAQHRDRDDRDSNRARVVVVAPQVRERDGFDRRRPRGYTEPAFARGYSDGFRIGADDGHDRDRYDPVRHREYRSGDKGYYREYGPKDAYKNNYRAGFRQGYEDGYRDRANHRRR